MALLAPLRPGRQGIRGPPREDDLGAGEQLGMPPLQRVHGGLEVPPESDAPAVDGVRLRTTNAKMPMIFMDLKGLNSHHISRAALY